jgi:hypothetical protein
LYGREAWILFTAGCLFLKSKRRNEGGYGKEITFCSAFFKSDDAYEIVYESPLLLRLFFFFYCRPVGLSGWLVSSSLLCGVGTPLRRGCLGEREERRGDILCISYR